jgi:alpha-tubulin suppressor-like RCC1 family protein
LRGPRGRRHRLLGGNGVGQLGSGTTTDSDVPVAVSGITNASSVAGGAENTCALLATGGVDCWGYNDNGQLGNGTKTNSDVPCRSAESPDKPGTARRRP